MPIDDFDVWERELAIRYGDNLAQTVSLLSLNDNGPTTRGKVDVEKWEDTFGNEHNFPHVYDQETDE